MTCRKHLPTSSKVKKLSKCTEFCCFCVVVPEQHDRRKRLDWAGVPDHNVKTSLVGLGCSVHSRRCGRGSVGHSRPGSRQRNRTKG